jgi:D-serine deaminase-like pyridoxal phosphate-dependent protein
MLNFRSEDIGKHKLELTTPCLLMDIDAIDRNIQKMSLFFSSRPCKLRPHAKTHKSPFIAHRQIQAGAIGITCAKLQDAKAFVEAGVDNILIANEVVGREKLHDLIDLATKTQIIVCVDNLQNAKDLSEVAINKGIKIDVLIEVDVGLKRCGLEPGLPTLQFLQRTLDLPGINFKGLMGYEGALFFLAGEEKVRECQKRNQLLINTKSLIEADGIRVEIVSAGGSNTYKITGNCEDVTEIQPGSYVTMDDWNCTHDIDFEPAITVLASVVSRPTKDRAIIDAGLKAISMDHGMPKVMNLRGATLTELNEEHGRLVLDDDSRDIIKVGDRLEIMPTHGCTTIPLYDNYITIKDDVVVDKLEIISRGAAY